MDEKKITPKAVRKEVSSWLKYLNEVVGVLCFTLGMSALGTGNPPFYAALSIIFVILFHIPNFKRARILSGLRKKNNRTEYENHALDDLLSQIKISNLLLLIFGYTFLAMVAFGWPLFRKSPEILTFIYGNI